jgi:hypothetical protein
MLLFIGVFLSILSGFLPRVIKLSQERSKNAVLWFYLASIGIDSAILALSVKSVLLDGIEDMLQMTAGQRMQLQLLLLTIVMDWSFFFFSGAEDIIDGVSVLLPRTITVHISDIISGSWLWIHHPLSVVGVAYQLHTSIGGGLMSLFLFDILTFFTGAAQEVMDLTGLSLRKNMHWIRFDLIPMVDLIFEFTIRTVFYSVVSCWAMWQVWFVRRDEVDFYWSVMISIWSAFAFATHLHSAISWTVPQLHMTLRRLMRRKTI